MRHPQKEPPPALAMEKGDGCRPCQVCGKQIRSYPNLLCEDCWVQMNIYNWRRDRVAGDRRQRLQA